MNGKYLQSIQFFIPLAIAWFFKSILSFLAGALFGMGKMTFLMVFSIVSVIITSLFLWITISHYGIIGAAYGMMFAAFLNLIIIEFFFRKKYGVKFFK
jgi:O-antigen/teichoic acid export membrane protein